jgi:hypothetical protein
VLGAAGLSLSLVSGVSAASGPVADMLTRNTGVNHQITLCEEEISDVSLATLLCFRQRKCRSIPARHKVCGRRLRLRSGFNLRSSFPPQQLRQFGDVGGDAPGLVAGGSVWNKRQRPIWRNMARCKLRRSRMRRRHR